MNGAGAAAQPPAEGALAAGPGAALRAERRARGLSTEEVADALRLQSAVVRSIERNDFHALPAPAYAHGYVRAYAKFLDMDAAPLVRDCGATLRVAPAPLVFDAAQKPLKDLPHRHPGWVFGGAALIVAAAASGVLWWAWPQDAPAPSPVAAALMPKGGDALVAVAAELPALSRGAAGAAAGKPAAATAPSAAGAGAPSVAVAPATAPAESAAAAARSLVFDFKEDCWVEVLDRRERSIHLDLNRAGQQLTLRGEAPFRIKLGNAPGVALEYEGHPVALAPHTRNQIANLVLE